MHLPLSLVSHTLLHQIGFTAQAFGEGLLPNFPPNGGGVTALSMVSTTALPFNCFLASAAAEGFTLEEMRRGIACSTVLAGLLSFFVVVTGSGIESTDNFSVSDVTDELRKTEVLFLSRRHLLFLINFCLLGGSGRGAIRYRFVRRRLLQCSVLRARSQHHVPVAARPQHSEPSVTFSVEPSVAPSVTGGQGSGNTQPSHGGHRVGSRVREARGTPLERD